jgi:hypothetical protein
MTADEEFAVFDLADLHELSNEKGDLFGLHLDATGKPAPLGTRQEQIAEFPLTQSGSAWHGYPTWPIMRLDREDMTRKYPAPAAALEKMKQAGLITETQRKRLRVGKTI